MRGEGKEVVKLLLSKGANVNDKDNLGRSPLDIASLFKNVEIKSILEKWPYTMGFISLQNLNVDNELWESPKDLYEFIGRGRNKKSKRFRKKKSKNNKKKRKTIRKRR